MKLKILGMLTAAASWVLSAGAQGLATLPSQPEGLAFPTSGWEAGELPQQSKDAVEALVAEAMGKTSKDLMGETRGLVIIWRGKLVAEAYGRHFSPETRQISWSMAKSVTQALVGAAIVEGADINLDVPMPTPYEPGSKQAEITWRQWLNAVDGLDYHELDGDPNPVKSDVVQLMYGDGRFDALGYAMRAFPLVHAPGIYWTYSTPAFHMIGHALQVTLGTEGKPKETKEAFDRILFDRIGMDTVVEFDPKGTYLGGSLVWASARDFAKFGYLYLRDGVWEGTQILPEGWVDFARTPGPASNTNVYGAGWWIIPDKGPLTHRQNADSEPRDAFHAGGHEGQTIWVVPSRDLVIVRLGLMPNEGENWPALYEWNQRVARAFPPVN
ncbi:serine hydrolase [Hyphomonas sp.]|uniref:serine hydrolase domain-containing protein n=1 Tax=Hyphomonas sp. TaxID=87 RepID=UPI0025C01A33|nr:serine hydrolase [Hyphomonas sp.]